METRRLGKTGHQSTVVAFGAYAIGDATQDASDRAIEEVAEVTRRLLDSLVTNAQPRIREVEIQRARIRSIKRFSPKET